jgi:hypothetical protein
VSVAGTADAHALAGTIVRVRKGRDVGDLRITQLSAPDPSDAPYARCLFRRPAGARLFNFDLNWTAMDLGLRGTAPAVHITLRGPGGAPVVAQVPISPAGDLACRLVRSFSLSSEPLHWGVQYSLTLVLPAGTPLRWLSVWVDGHPVRVRLTQACPQPHCYHGFPDIPSLFAAGTPYSVGLTI